MRERQRIGNTGADATVVLAETGGADVKLKSAGNAAAVVVKEE